MVISELQAIQVVIEYIEKLTKNGEIDVDDRYDANYPSLDSLYSLKERLEEEKTW